MKKKTTTKKATAAPIDLSEYWTLNKACSELKLAYSSVNGWSDVPRYTLGCGKVVVRLTELAEISERKCKRGESTLYDRDAISRLRRSGMRAADVADQIGCSIATVYLCET